jgi:predicted nucleic acid-binding protein
MLVDTNVLIDVLNNEPQWADWSIHQLRVQSKIHVLSINPIIYAELSCTFKKVEDLDEVLQVMELKFNQIPKPALFLACKAFQRYRRLGGVKNSILADFFIGAHAAVSRLPVLTRDTQRYQTYFPTVKLVSPNALH